MVTNDEEWNRMSPEEKRRSDYYTLCLLIDKHLRELEKWTDGDMAMTINLFSAQKDWTSAKIAEALATAAVGTVTEELVRYHTITGEHYVESEADAHRLMWESIRLGNSVDCIVVGK